MTLDPAEPSVDRDRDEVDDFVAAAALQRRRLPRQRGVGDRQFGEQQRGGPGGDSFGAQKQMKMPVLVALYRARFRRRPRRRMAVIEILRMARRIVDLALGKAAPGGDVGGTVDCLLKN